MAKQNIAEDNSTPTGANKFSVYAKRNAASRVDWGTIAGDISTEIKSIDDERKELKAVIDADTTTTFKEIAEVGNLNGVRLNEEVIEASNQSSEVLRIAYRNLKSGAISPTQYKMIMQRQKNNYSELSSAAKNYSTWFTEQQKRNAELGGSEMEMTVANGTAGFGNLDNKKFWVDPLSGSIMLVTMQEDEEGNLTVMPKFKDNPEFFQNVSAINNRYNFKEDRKILSEETAKLVDPLKDVITSKVSELTALDGGGVVTSTDDLSQDKDFNQILVDNVGALTATGNDVAQILTGQTIGSPYKLAQSLDEFKRKHPDLGEEYFIKYVMDNGVAVAQPTDAQTKEAKDRAERSLKSQIDSIIKQSAPQSAKLPSASASAGTAREDRQFAYLQDIEKVVSGIGAEREGAYTSLIDTYNRGAEAGDQIDSIRLNDNRIVIIRKDGSELPIKRRSANLDANGVQIIDNPKTKNIDEAFTSTEELDEIVFVYEALTGTPMSTSKAQSIIDKNNFKIRPKNTIAGGMRVKRKTYPKITGNEKIAGLNDQTFKEFLLKKLNKNTKWQSNTKVKDYIIEAVDESVPGKISQILADQNLPSISSTYQLLTETDASGYDRTYVQFALGATVIKVMVFDDSNPKQKDVDTSVIAGQIQNGINKWITDENVKQSDTTLKVNTSFMDWKKLDPANNISFPEYINQLNNGKIK